MKIKELFKRLTPSFLCAHANKHSVIIRDYYYDEMTDNDDLDEFFKYYKNNREELEELFKLV